MRKQCAWCGGSMDDESGSPEEGQITHGMCEVCRNRLLARLGTPMEEFIEALPEPVLVLQEDVVIEAMNAGARLLLGKDLGAVRGKPAGEVFRCANEGRSGACGERLHCAGCAIRRTVADTFLTGTPHLRVPATVVREPDDGPEEMSFHISTERIDGRVLLRIDPAS